MSELTRESVLSALRSVIDPVFEKPMLEIGTLDVAIDNGHVRASVRLASPSAKVRAQVEERVAEALAPLGVPIDLHFEAQVPTREVMGDDPIPGVKNVVLVMSGKGGVGKS